MKAKEDEMNPAVLALGLVGVLVCIGALIINLDEYPFGNLNKFTFLTGAVLVAPMIVALSRQRELDILLFVVGVLIVLVILLHDAIGVLSNRMIGREDQVVWFIGIVLVLPYIVALLQCPFKTEH